MESIHSEVSKSQDYSNQINIKHPSMNREHVDIKGPEFEGTSFQSKEEESGNNVPDTDDVTDENWSDFENLQLGSNISDSSNGHMDENLSDCTSQNAQNNASDTNGPQQANCNNKEKDNDEASLIPMVKSPEKTKITGPLGHINHTQLYGNLFTKFKQLKETHKLSIPQLFDLLDKQFDTEITDERKDKDLSTVALIKGYEVIIRLGGTGKMWHQKLKKLHKNLASYQLPQHNFVASVLCHDLYTTYFSRHKMGKACECLKIVKYTQQNTDSGLWGSELCVREAMVALKQAQINPHSRQMFYQRALHYYSLAREHWIQHGESLFDGSTNYSIAYQMAHMTEIQLDLPTPGFIPIFLKTKTLQENAAICKIGIGDIKVAEDMLQSAKQFASNCHGQYAYVHFYVGIAEIYLKMRRAQVQFINRCYPETERDGNEALEFYDEWNSKYFNEINPITVVLKEQLQPVISELVYSAKLQQDILVTNDNFSDT